jgi:hypothetical protein
MTGSNQIVISDSGKPVVAKTIDRAAAVDKAEMYVLRNLPKYLRKIQELAMGIQVAKDTKLGLKIYAEAPNLQALTYLADRGLGKIPQRHELTGEGGGPVTVLPWAPVGMLDEDKNIIEGEATEVPLVEEE